MGNGKNLYEKGNHLGNVLVTVSDKKIGVDNNSDGIIDYYNADVVTANDYYPYGMQMPGRKYSNGSNYRYSFNGQEKDIELNENITTAEYWEYDARIGRRWNIDPVVKDDESPYSTFSGSPIVLSDPDGDDAKNGEGDDPPKRGAKQVQHTKGAQDGIAPNGDLILMGKKNTGVHVVSTNLGTDKKADFRVTYFFVEGENGGWSWNNDKRAFINTKGEEFSNGLPTAVFNKLGMSTGTNLSEGATNIINGEPLKDTRQAYSQYKQNGGGGAVPGFLFNGLKTNVSTWYDDMQAGGNRGRDAWIGLFNFSSNVAMGESFVGGGATVLSRVDNSFTSSTGGMKQWFRLGPSYSVAGKFKTFGLRWGASPKYADKIGNNFLRNLNQSFRKYKLPGNSWRTADKGHLHFRKK